MSYYRLLSFFAVMKTALLFLLNKVPLNAPKLHVVLRVESSFLYSVPQVEHPLGPKSRVYAAVLLLFLNLQFNGQPVGFEILNLDYFDTILNSLPLHQNSKNTVMFEGNIFRF